MVKVSLIKHVRDVGIIKVEVNLQRLRPSRRGSLFDNIQVIILEPCQTGHLTILVGREHFFDRRHCRPSFQEIEMLSPGSGELSQETYRRVEDTFFDIRVIQRVTGGHNRGHADWLSCKLIPFGIGSRLHGLGHRGHENLGIGWCSTDRITPILIHRIQRNGRFSSTHALLLQELTD